MSFGKRVDRIGGRRRALRERVLAAARAVTLKDGKIVVLTNLSCTGARMRGYALDKGTVVWIRTGSIDTLATVIWRKSDMCGIAFDEPLRLAQLKQIRRATGTYIERRLTPEEQLAAEDWQSGFAR